MSLCLLFVCCGIGKARFACMFEWMVCSATQHGVSKVIVCMLCYVRNWVNLNSSMRGIYVVCPRTQLHCVTKLIVCVLCYVRNWVNLNSSIRGIYVVCPRTQLHCVTKVIVCVLCYVRN